MHPRCLPALAVRNQIGWATSWVMTFGSATALDTPGFLKAAMMPDARSGSPTVIRTTKQRGIIMAVVRKIFGTSIAIAIALTVTEPSPALAQHGHASGASPAQ